MNGPLNNGLSSSFFCGGGGIRTFDYLIYERSPAYFIIDLCDTPELDSYIGDNKCGSYSIPINLITFTMIAVLYQTQQILTLCRKTYCCWMTVSSVSRTRQRPITRVEDTIIVIPCTLHKTISVYHVIPDGKIQILSFCFDKTIRI